MTNRKYENRRAREHLTPAEITALLQCAAAHSKRDHLMLLLAYRHGLRVNELLGLTWQNVDLINGLLAIRRLKEGLHNGIGRNAAAHPLKPDEIRLLTEWRQLTAGKPGDKLFSISARMVRYLIADYGNRVGLANLHPHMLRHSCATHVVRAARGNGSKLTAEELIDLKNYMGHRAISSTMFYVGQDHSKFSDLQGAIV